MNDNIDNTVPILLIYNPTHPGKNANEQPTNASQCIIDNHILTPWQIVVPPYQLHPISFLTDSLSLFLRGGFLRILSNQDESKRTNLMNVSGPAKLLKEDVMRGARGQLAKEPLSIRNRIK